MSSPEMKRWNNSGTIAQGIETRCCSAGGWEWRTNSSATHGLSPSPSGGGPGWGWASCQQDRCRSEEHTSELQSLMRISYAVFCLKKKKSATQYHTRLSAIY